MKEQIEIKIKDWQQELDKLTARRRQLEQAQQENEMSIQRHLGAITGAQQLLGLITQPPPDEPEPEPRVSDDGPQVDA